MLNRLGYEADLANDGLEAVQTLKDQPYDLVFMDVQMPGLSGLEATEQIRQIIPTQEQPIIVALTANAMKGDKEAFIAAGMDDYLSKPLRLERLDELLKKHISKIKERE